MALDSEIFIQSHQTLEELKEDLARILRLEFSHWDEQNHYWAVLAKEARVLLYAHHYRPVGALQFDQFAFVLAVEGPQAVTRKLFRKLSGANRWRLLMTDDLQIRLDAFEPTAESGSAA